MRSGEREKFPAAPPSVENGIHGPFLLNVHHTEHGQVLCHGRRTRADIASLQKRMTDA